MKVRSEKRHNQQAAYHIHAQTTPLANTLVSFAQIRRASRHLVGPIGLGLQPKLGGE
jgi:hypothetical protein